MPAVAALLAAHYADGQIQVADQQKIVAEQQQLLMLVVDIEQEPAAVNQATANINGPALITVQVQYQDELTSYPDSGAHHQLAEQR